MLHLIIEKKYNNYHYFLKYGYKHTKSPLKKMAIQGFDIRQKRNYESCKNFEIKAQPIDKGKSPKPFYMLKKFDLNAVYIRGSRSISKRSFDIEGSVVAKKGYTLHSWKKTRFLLSKNELKIHG